MNAEQLKKLREHMKDVIDYKAQTALSEKKQIDKKMEGFREGCSFVIDLVKQYDPELR